MICPNCKNESNGARWCPHCGLQLEIDDAANVIFGQREQQENEPAQADAVTHEEVPSASAPQTGYTEDYSTDYSADYSSPPGSYGTDYAAPEEEEPSNKKLKIILAIICPITAVVLIFVILAISGVIDFGKTEEVVETQENVVLEDEDSETLMKTAMNQLKIGDYEEAETVFKAVMEIDPDNEEATVLCQIVYNYNRALKKIQSKKYKEARTFLEKIPAEYMDYSIRTDVENLEDEISAFESAYVTFADIKSYMKSGDYEDAQDAIAIIDDSYLEDSDAALLSEYSIQIKQHLKEEEEEKQSKKQNELSEKQAEALITEYCEDYVRAINNKDFSIVSKHISGQLYTQQKKQVQSCIDKGITEGLDKVELKTLHQISDTKWKAEVSEAETIYYADGTSESKSFEWTYTIEYIDSAFYLTKIE